ncbi:MULTISPECIES: polymorphic toxin type 35 domain-containing protein [Anaerococcus]|uniref:polymorphic toxin type 35 domain-containing protein n=1 Tax=Anaerococcus TaxID=165779 RepID=UPI001AE80A56|nr:MULTISPECIES: polymorphic toxin type 35 domain-containing protein [Anaerococcus]MBP2070185.1 hypothetical protein [Anaerococcus nagyae]MDU1829502.1 polymorphic toxin type 35 domain-containing protein [Anaerococcus sp.]MDU1865343.1 polymorphic toxin type 35 domain-containing protein [Anaerococcus sp.]
MSKKYNKIISFLLAMIMMLSGIFCNSHTSYAQEVSKVINVEENTVITLEDGRKVTAEEFLDILENYSGDIYKINDKELESVSKNISRSENGIALRSAGAIPMNDVMKIMAGTWYIPGIGEIVVAGGAILIGGVAIYKVSGWMAEQVKNWLTSRAVSKQAERAVNGLGDVNSNRANHILQTKHKWSSLVPGGSKDPNRWNKIKEIIKKVLIDGKESKYGSAYKKTLNYKGKVVEVTFQKLKDGVISISNAWVK